jgi:hypothetical protein
MSSTNLDNFKSIIDLGLKHIPRPKDTSNEEILESLDKLKHKIGWQYFFRNQPLNPNPPLFKNENPSPFHFGNTYQEPKILAMIIRLRFNYYFRQHPPRDIPDPIRKLKTFLKAHPMVKMIASDKNLGLVAIDLPRYHQLVLNHLHSDKYREVEPVAVSSFFQPCYNRVSQRFQRLIRDHILVLDFPSDVVKYFKAIIANKKEFTIPIFHVLIKLHKGLNPLTSRPIVGAVNWFTTPVSKLLSHELKPLLITSHSIAINTMDVVTEIGHFNNFHSTRLASNDYIYLVTMDVASLYTNIDLDRLAALLDERLRPLFDFVCRNNYFQYNKTVYQQTNGIAMGTNAAPELANLYLATELDPYISRTPNVVLYKRYLDDLLIFWKGDRNSLDTFVEELNHLIPGIRFDTNIDRHSANFLDLHIKYEHGSITHATHQKKLNKYGYITPSTCHPRHTLRGFIKAELTRYAINSSRHYYYLVTKNLFYKRLLARGYQHRFLEPIFQRHMYNSRYTLSTTRDTNDKLILPIRYSFRPKLMESTRTIIAACAPEIQPVLPGKKLMIAWKKSPNLFSSLTSSKLTEAQSMILGKI